MLAPGTVDRSRLDLDELKTELDEYGFVVVPNIFTSADASRMAGRVREVLCRQPDVDRPDQTLRGVLNYIEADDPLLDLFIAAATIPVYLELARHLLGDGFQMG